MSATFEIKMSLYSDEARYIPEPVPVVSIINGSQTLKDDGYMTVNAVLERVRDVAKETPPKFKILWKPADKHKSLFAGLKTKGSKEPFTIGFRFIFKEEGKILWMATGLCKNAKVVSLVKSGKDTGASETVSFQCKSFTHTEGSY